MEAIMKPVVRDGRVYIGTRSVGRVHQLDSYKVGAGAPRWVATDRVGQQTRHQLKREAVQYLVESWGK